MNSFDRHWVDCAETQRAIGIGVVLDRARRLKTLLELSYRQGNSGLNAPIMSRAVERLAPVVDLPLNLASGGLELILPEFQDQDKNFHAAVMKQGDRFFWWPTGQSCSIADLFAVIEERRKLCQGKMTAHCMVAGRNPRSRRVQFWLRRKWREIACYIVYLNKAEAALGAVLDQSTGPLPFKAICCKGEEG